MDWETRGSWVVSCVRVITFEVDIHLASATQGPLRSHPAIERRGPVVCPYFGWRLFHEARSPYLPVARVSGGPLGPGPRAPGQQLSSRQLPDRGADPDADGPQPVLGERRHHHDHV